jgi:hypothetical protein
LFPGVLSRHVARGGARWPAGRRRLEHPVSIGVLIMFWLYVVVIVAGLSVYITLAIAG